jgi:hypothetical protein
MSTIRGTIQDGKVVLDEPANLPDGTRVVLAVPGEEYVGVGMREEDWPTDEAGIAALVASMDQIQPFLTPEDEERWRQALAEQKAWELANWDAHCKKIEDLFK